MEYVERGLRSVEIEDFFWNVRNAEDVSKISIFHFNFPCPVPILGMSMLIVENKACVIWK